MDINDPTKDESSRAETNGLDKIESMILIALTILLCLTENRPTFAIPRDS
jgi:hypothetical protein